MDSLVCASIALKEHQEVYFLHLNYQQKTSLREQEAFHKICEHYKVDESHKKVISLSFLAEIGGSSLTDNSIHVDEYTKSDQSKPTSYVPFRNSIILSLAVSWAEVLKADSLYIGANEEDSPGYPDCREVYYQAFQTVMNLGSNANIKLRTPVIDLTKKAIIERGQQNKVPFHLSWSCYKSSDKACGICDSCTLRLRGFKELNQEDPIEYQ